MTRHRGNGLPLVLWAAALGVLAVAATVGGALAVLAVQDRLDDGTATALAVGATSGLVVCLVGVVLVARLAGNLRRLREAAALTLAPEPLPGRLLRSASLEVAALAAAVDALQQRVRLADALADRHRHEAETAGAGVFELLSGLVAAEEGARGQLAAELHDTVAQSLMIARGMLAAGPSTPAELAKLSDYVEDAEEQVRAVMARTRPPALRDGDLASAVGMLRLDMGARYGLEVVVTWPPSPYPLPLASAITVYRFFQEALLNVVKHADVDEACICLEVGEEAVLATVHDEGPGFDPGAVRPDRGRHVGLGLLRERARLAGGQLEVDSWRGEGTTLSLRVPRPRPIGQEVPVTDPLPQQRADERRRAGLSAAAR